MAEGARRPEANGKIVAKVEPSLMQGTASAIK
jgi:hypothetical protein